MADKGDDYSDRSRTRATMAAKAKHVIWWEEDSDKKESTELSLCLVGKLWTIKRFNSKSFVNTITKIWNPRKGLEAKKIDTNNFLFQFPLKRLR